MKPIDFNVREVRQTSSAADYIVSYTARVSLDSETSEVSVSVNSTIPADADGDMVVDAAELIRSAVATVLSGRGAHVTLEKLVIHPVDFSPKKFTEHTLRHFQAALNAAQQ